MAVLSKDRPIPIGILGLNGNTRAEKELYHMLQGSRASAFRREELTEQTRLRFGGRHTRLIQVLLQFFQKASDAPFIGYSNSVTVVLEEPLVA